MYSWIVLSALSRFRRIIFFHHLTFYQARKLLQLFDLKKTFQSYNCNYHCISSKILRVSGLYMLWSSWTVFIPIDIWQFALIIPSTYSWIWSLLNTCIIKIHRKEEICGLQRTWNSTIIAKYLTIPNEPFKTIVWKKVSTLNWNWRASRTRLKFK